MSNTGDELVATYYFGARHIQVYGCWDSETTEGEFDFYDIYETNTKGFSECLNEGCPFDDGLPTRAEVKEFLEENKI